MRRTLRALGFITVLPIETWPSPAMTVRPPFLTPMMVVPCHWIRPWLAACSFMRRIYAQACAVQPRACIIRSRFRAAAGPPAPCRRADRADVAEQVLDERAVAAQRRGLVPVGASLATCSMPRFSTAATLPAFHRSGPGRWSALKCGDGGTAASWCSSRHSTSPFAELADEGRAAERAFHRNLVVDARLDSVDEDAWSAR
jgi:hypothetical protein